MNKIFFFVFLSIMLFESCKQHDVNEINSEDFVNMLLTEGNLIEYKSDVEAVLYLNDNEIKSNNIYYCLNSHCSICIGEFLSFMELFVNNNCNSNVNVIVSKEDSISIDYYIHKIPQIVNICNVVTDSNIINNKLSPFEYNGIIGVFNNKKKLQTYLFSYQDSKER